MDTKAYFQEQERRYNKLMAAFKKNGQIRDALSKVLNTEIVKLRKRIKASNTRADARDAEMAILLRDAKDLRERWAALEHGRDLDELGDFAVRYCEFKIALQPRASTTSVGKKHKSKKSKKSSKHANGHSLVPTVRPSNEWVFRPYRYTKLCEIIAKLTPDDFPDQPDAKLVFQAGLEEFERLATEAQKRFSLL
ncbi:hypothetical protein SPRG_18085 [Saprolegnia parasitica CBS 223.65]|uniref:Uncharacterized protein n=1 Tax=Saprolegnia parasitica (strain CBS 223.65) TaxID=695850 RepID=A0A067BI28_SAPPC|nr:hypothetical protein SPRG_18085 [Saprolegnia parasitica CBS 223.65]KDO16390.1 hypothetical protein SPRG_18085 [Saprolegnia parasitica CBS 223.65]|eukprot:XP_012212902.1 hypothetical protein SPRG_18085 [Saprolegnia parasitica CBS 223.65]